jgi:hypothetical protein
MDEYEAEEIPFTPPESQSLLCRLCFFDLDELFDSYYNGNVTAEFAESVAKTLGGNQ